MKKLLLGFLTCVVLASHAMAQTPAPSSVASPSASVPTIGLPPEAPKLQAKKIQPRTNHVFSALVLATTVESPAGPSPELAAFAPKLQTVFGYNQFELVGSHMELMDRPAEQWLVPSKLFSLSVKSKIEPSASYLLNMQLFQENKLLAGFDAKLNPESPIFIRGPLYGKGQLVIVVEVRK